MYIPSKNNVKHIIQHAIISPAILQWIKNAIWLAIIMIICLQSFPSHWVETSMLNKCSNLTCILIQGQSLRKHSSQVAGLNETKTSIVYPALRLVHTGTKNWATFGQCVQKPVRHLTGMLENQQLTGIQSALTSNGCDRCVLVGVGVRQRNCDIDGKNSAFVR